ncbi:MAG: hypothetical protein ACRC62_07175 [Microcoleus sp.]
MTVQNAKISQALLKSIGKVLHISTDTADYTFTNRSHSILT